ncbi:hypothetical protein [Delftia tsuruhatensis]|uniref:hypothetical protein n=1 Tax=Delftia tsuruhatensis TaxID=180282 RepID=UPI00244C5175|nr:hypothetical protein [Delftia tsuruhatensis]MDH0423513.1 hypothetical protein [Delftia tsuruhatensis]
MKVNKLNDKRKQAQRASYKAAVLDAFDALFPKERQQQAIGKPQRLDTDPEVRRKAKQQL